MRYERKQVAIQFLNIHIHNAIKLTTPIDYVLFIFLISNFHSFFICPHLSIVSIFSIKKLLF